MSIIVISATFDVDPKRRDDLLREAQPLIQAALAERGCRAYTWSVDIMDPRRIHVFEEWDDEAALDFHFKNAAYRDMGAKLRTVERYAGVSAKYRVDAKAPVYNDQGVATVEFPKS